MFKEKECVIHKNTSSIGIIKRFTITPSGIIYSVDFGSETMRCRESELQKYFKLGETVKTLSGRIGTIVAITPKHDYCLLSIDGEVPAVIYDTSSLANITEERKYFCYNLWLDDYKYIPDMLVRHAVEAYALDYKYNLSIKDQVTLCITDNHFITVTIDDTTKYFSYKVWAEDNKVGSSYLEKLDGVPFNVCFKAVRFNDYNIDRKHFE